MPGNPDSAVLWASLSKRERSIATKFAEGLTYLEIGAALFIAPTTVRTHLATIYRKLDVHNKAALINLVVAQRALEDTSAEESAATLSPQPLEDAPAEQDGRVADGHAQAAPRIDRRLGARVGLGIIVLAGVGGVWWWPETERATTTVVAADTILSMPPNGPHISQWIADWWRWNLQTPTPTNPGLDKTGEHCAVGQSGRVWFLAGSYFSDPVIRRCTIPAGTALFFPIANGFWVSSPKTSCSEEDPWYLADEREEWAKFEREVIQNPNVVWTANTDDALTLELDGKLVRGIDKFYARSVVFDAQLPEDNVFDVIYKDCPAMFTSPNVGWGYHVFLNPLPPGEHELHWTAKANHGAANQNITYHLTVTPPSPAAARPSLHPDRA